jgi:hypothetical protein
MLPRVRATLSFFDKFKALFIKFWFTVYQIEDKIPVA